MSLITYRISKQRWIWIVSNSKHVINLFIQYTPYKPSDGSWEDPAYRESFAQRCFTLIDEYAPGFSSSIIRYDMLTPPDLEREIGLTGLFP
ncbi:Pyridine nucleotide-disulfide oxidoreductase domain-containing protein 2 [Camellia lanceoleosa]|uniref:Pyridine nucleotide-disulfide oxidoreductase domain-containing protein 2 n=1 Tax=Camellia lanceoleosa TaxID=1840588 RepID=A0ACC0HA12_9ERIC|nr:Pyridine nucleotide-disulfide oxidoreductase domain-containing protein 2 [Camellia lanceoleosa]